MGIEYAMGLLATICLGLSAWALKRVFSHESEIARLQSLGDETVRKATILQEVRDHVLELAGSNRDLLNRFSAFELRYDERSMETAKLANELDKRVALIELHLKYQGDGRTHG